MLAGTLVGDIVSCYQPKIMPNWRCFEDPFCHGQLLAAVVTWEQWHLCQGNVTPPSHRMPGLFLLHCKFSYTSTALYPPAFSFPYLALLFSFTPTSLLLNQNCLFVKSHCTLKVFAAKNFYVLFLLNDLNTSVSFSPCYLWFQLCCQILIPCQHDTGVMETRGWWWSNGFGLYEWRK